MTSERREVAYRIKVSLLQMLHRLSWLPRPVLSDWEGRSEHYLRRAGFDGGLDSRNPSLGRGRLWSDARPRKYPRELLDRGARVVVESGRPIAHVARDLGIPSETLRKYVRQLEADEGLRPDLPTAAEREEIKAG